MPVLGEVSKQVCVRCLEGRKEESVQVFYLNFLAAVVIIFCQQVEVIRV